MKYILEGGEVKKIDSLSEWALWIIENNKTIGLTPLRNIKVKTVFLGFDMGEEMAEDVTKPLVFKTYVCGPGTFLNGYSEYFSTFEEAIEGHKRVVEKIRTICQ
jgi:hypothetical protein